MKLYYLLMLALFLLTVKGALAVTVESGNVTFVPSGSNVTYAATHTIFFDEIKVTPDSFVANNLTSNATGNATIRIRNWTTTYAWTNISSGNIINFSFVHATATNDYWWFLENSFGTSRFNRKNFSVTPVDAYEQLYMEYYDLPKGSLQSGGAGAAPQMTQSLCTLMGNSWYNGTCYTCEGAQQFDGEKYVCTDCEDGFHWDGTMCVIDVEGFSIEDYVEEHQTLLSLGISAFVAVILIGSRGIKDDSQNS